MALKGIISFLLLVILPLQTSAQIHGLTHLFVPEKGAKGKDVIWLPTADFLVNAMLDVANIGLNDVFFDLGSGDGRIVIEAAKRGAIATGIEYEKRLVELSRNNAEMNGVSKNAIFINADLFEADFSTATVISLFLSPEANLKLRPQILALKPGTRVVSNSFDMGDWKPNIQLIFEYEDIENNDISTSIQLRKSEIFMWIVPEKNREQ